MKKASEMTNQELYTYAKTLIPGGTQLLSKRPEQFAPNQWPNYATKGKGCQVWDVEGNCYTDMTTNGIGACLLGYADPDVTAAVVKRVQDGSMTTLNAPEEVYLAERLCQIHPWAESVRFARTGGETCAMAVRIARATTGRDLVAICGYHGWSDWYIAANLGNSSSLDGQLLPGLSPAGVPRGLAGTTLSFFSNDYEAFDGIIAEYGDRLACVVMEPMRGGSLTDEFRKHVREATKKVGALLIYDEITIGWRHCFGGAHLDLGITPDMATFAKALGNGHPIGAVIGTKEAMDGAQSSFISSTYWTEAVGPTAALATIDKMERTKVWEHVKFIGATMKKHWAESAASNGVAIKTGGMDCLAHFSFDQDHLETRTLYTVLMLKEGYLAGGSIYPTLAHNEEVLARHREAMDKVFYQIGQLQKAGGKDAILAAIGGPVAQTGFKRLVD